MTNATKAAIIALANAAIQAVEAFGLVELSERQEGAVIALVNALALLYVALTYKKSPKRIPDVG